MTLYFALIFTLLFAVAKKGLAFEIIPWPTAIDPLLVTMGYGNVPSTSTRYNWYLAELSDVSKFKMELGNNGCSVHQTTSSVARLRGCVAASNAGFFGFTPPVCEGNLVVGGEVINWSNVTPALAFFGFTANATVVGGLKQSDVAALGITSGVSGSSQLVLSGAVDTAGVEAGIKHETARRLAKGDKRAALNRALQVAPRTGFGVKSDGRAFILVVDGVEALNLGLTLPEFAEVMSKTFGAKAAINADGGGSTTFVVNGTIFNRPTTDDQGPIGERAVTSIACIRK
jgi:exopolysaccharide biosynthesis protein